MLDSNAFNMLCDSQLGGRFIWPQYGKCDGCTVSLLAVFTIRNFPLKRLWKGGKAAALLSAISYEVSVPQNSGFPVPKSGR